MLLVRSVSKSYRSGAGTVLALAPIDLELRAGETVALRGPSGSGKSTLLLACGGLLRPDHGSISVDGQDLGSLGPAALDRLRAERIGFVFQRLHLIPYLDVEANVLLAATTSAARHRADSLLSRFGLAARRRHLPEQLSIGERQRTVLARALVMSPGLILADEPTGSLDRALADTVLCALEQAAAEGAAVLVATHDAQVAARMSRCIDLVPGAAP